MNDNTQKTLDTLVDLIKNGGEIEKVSHKSLNGEHTFTFVLKDVGSIFKLKYNEELINKLQAEKKELTDKINKLDNFMQKYDYYTDELSRAYLYHMAQQQQQMQDYLKSLNERIILIKKAKKAVDK